MARGLAVDLGLNQKAAYRVAVTTEIDAGGAMPCTVLVVGVLLLAVAVLVAGAVVLVPELVDGAGAALVDPVAVTFDAPVDVELPDVAWPQADSDKPTATAIVAIDQGRAVAGAVLDCGAVVARGRDDGRGE